MIHLHFFNEKCKNWHMPVVAAVFPFVVVVVVVVVVVAAAFAAVSSKRRKI